MKSKSLWNELTGVVHNTIIEYANEFHLSPQQSNANFIEYFAIFSKQCIFFQFTNLIGG